MCLIFFFNGYVDNIVIFLIILYFKKNFKNEMIENYL